MRTLLILVLALIFVSLSYGKISHHKVQWGDTLYSLSKRYKVSYQSLYSLNPRLSKYGLKKGDRLKIAKNGPIVHKVEKGDTIWSISRRYGISAQKLQNSNSLNRKNNIVIGQNINITPQKGIAFSSNLNNNYYLYKRRQVKRVLFWPTSNAKVIKAYGKSSHLFNAGIRLKTRKGISTSLDGMVTFVGKWRGYGNTIVVNHYKKGLTTIYCSKEMLPLVTVGSRLRARDKIGIINRQAKELVLDFYVLSGNSLEDPMDYLKMDKEL